MIAQIVTKAQKAIRHPVSRNAMALFGLRFAIFVLPLLTIPYLARVLLPACWGTVVFAQAYSIWLWLLLEYGFNFTATRDIARNRDDRSFIARTVASVLGAKSLLAVLAILVSILAWRFSTVFQQHPDFLIWATLYSLVQGMNPLWYFQGIERMGMRVMVDILVRALVAAGIFVVVHCPADGGRVLALQALGSVASTGILLALMYREVEWRWPTWSDALQTLRQGFSMFIFRGGSSLYTVANTVILGLYLPPTAVAYYGGADKIIITVKGFMEPISQAVFPRMSNLLASDPARAARFARLLVIVMCLFGLLLGSGIMLGGPKIVHLLFGVKYLATIPILQVLCLTIPVISLGTVLGVQWLLPMGLDKPFSCIVIGAGLFNLGLARVLVPHYGPMGMAWSVVATECSVVLALLVVLLHHRKHSRNTAPPAVVVGDRLQATPAV